MISEQAMTTQKELDGEWRDRVAIPDHVIWGPGSYKRVRKKIEELGCSRVLLLTSGSLRKRTPWVERIQEELGHLVVLTRSDSQEFTPDWLCFDTAREARVLEPDVVVTVGGGSVADWGKAVAFILAQGLESVAELDAYVASPDNQQLSTLSNPPIPQVAIPTTLSASEATWSVTINRPERKFKDHVRHPDLVPNTVILDAAIASSTPAQLWCATGLKAMEHVVEKLYTVDRNPVVDNMCLKAGELLYRYLPRCKDNPEDLEAFTQCHIALVGVGFHGRGVHKGLSQVIGWQLGAYGVAHGHTSCIMLSHVMRFNRSVSESAQAALGRALGSQSTNDADLAVDAEKAVSGLVRDLDLPHRLRDVGVPRSDLSDIAQKVIVSPNIIYNPRPVSDPAEVLALLEEAW
jgi:alcohol dehydrogenase